MRSRLFILSMSIALLPSMRSQQRLGQRQAPAPNIPFKPSMLAADCPNAAESNPPAGPVQPTDFVELQRTPCFGPCPVYTVQIRGDGQVHWRQPSLGSAGAVATV